MLRGGGGGRPRGGGHDADALESFRRIADSSYEHVYFPVEYVRSLYYLGQLCEKQGDREKARQASCLSNLKQIGNALTMYVQDYDEVWPPASLERWRDIVAEQA